MSKDKIREEFETWLFKEHNLPAQSISFTVEELMFELWTEYKSTTADLRAQLAAANKRLEDAEGQEPQAFTSGGNVKSFVSADYARQYGLSTGWKPLYTRPIPPADELAKAREEGYLLGFNASGEGWNGEYPFQDNGKSPLQDEQWISCRDNTLAAPKPEGDKK